MVGPSIEDTVFSASTHSVVLMSGSGRNQTVAGYLNERLLLQRAVTHVTAETLPSIYFKFPD